MGKSAWSIKQEEDLDAVRRDAMLPQMIDKYSSIYNTNGRIGIYTREVTKL
jgi:hypothetical protein